MHELLSNLCGSIDGQDVPREGYEMVVDVTAPSQNPTLPGVSR